MASSTVGSTTVPDVPNPLDEWLPKVAADPIHVDESPSGLNEEANANLWGLGFSGEELRGVTEDDVLRFARAAEDPRERQILERFGRAHPMVFYCWFDEQAGQFRLSLVSASHGRLPFGDTTDSSSPVEAACDLGDIVRAFLADAYHGGIPMGEFRAMTQEDLDAYIEPPAIFPLVWSRLLPRGGG